MVKRTNVEYDAMPQSLTQHVWSWNVHTTSFTAS